jgi:hypothetical protein
LRSKRRRIEPQNPKVLGHKHRAAGYVPKPQLAELLDHSRKADYYGSSKLWDWWNAESSLDDDAADADDDNLFDYMPPSREHRPEYQKKPKQYNMRYDHYLQWQVIKESGSEKELLRQILTSTNKDVGTALKHIYNFTLIRERQKFIESKLLGKDENQEEGGPQI